MAKTSVKMAKKAIQVAKVTAKATIKVLTSAIKAIIATTKAIVTALIAGGWVAVLIVVVFCSIGLIFCPQNGIYGSINSISSTNIVGVAKSQLGNSGGEPFWSWYGFTARVEWCACFVSWCANQCGYIDGGIIPKFAKCTDGVTWFQTYGRWKDGGYAPKSRRYNIF